MTINIRILSILMILIIVLNMIITIGVLYMARHSSGRLIQVMQFISYLSPGSCTVEINTLITILARLSNIGAAVSPILLPGGGVSICCTRCVSSGCGQVLNQASRSVLWLGVDWASGVVWLKGSGCTVS